MPETIWKYELRPGLTTVEMPSGAEALTVAAQGEGVCLWARVTPENPTEVRQFYTLGTGHTALIPLGRYVGTAFLGPLVFHTFEPAGR